MTSKQYNEALSRLPEYEQEIRRLARRAHSEMLHALMNAGNAVSSGYHEKRAEELLYELELRLIKENEL